MKKVLKYIAFLAPIAILTVVIIILSMKQQTSDSEWKDKIKGVEIVNKDGIRLIKNKAAAPSLDAIVFIHGAPGEASQFSDYLTSSDLLHSASVYTLDRPGYGDSDYGEPVTSIAIQAERIHDVLMQEITDSTRITLVSHSYGGPIAAHMSLIDSSRYHAHLMLCPVIDPVSEPMFWYAGAPLWWPLRYISSGAMQVSAYEKKSHPSELTKIQDYWKDNEVNTLMIQGAKDWLAPIENAEFVKKHFPAKNTQVVVLEEESHFIPFNKQDYVIEQILMLIQNKTGK